MGSVFLLVLHVLKENGIFTPSSNFTDTVHKDQIVHMSDFLNSMYTIILSLDPHSGAVKLP